MSISQFILDDREQARLTARLRNKWMIQIRWYYTAILMVVALGTMSLIGMSDTTDEYLVLGLTSIILNGGLWLMSLPKKARLGYYKLLAIFQILLDMGVASFVLYTQGGLNSRTTVLFAIPILTAGLLLRGKFALLTAGLSATAYAAAILAYVHWHQVDYPLRTILVPIAFYTCVYFILASIVMRYGRVNEQDERQRSYQELLSMLRHQLRNPISVVAALVEMLEHSPAFPTLPVKDRQYITQLKYENQRLNAMVSNLLQAASPDHLQAANQEIELVELITSVASTAATAYKRSNDLRLELSVQQIYISGSDDLRLAFENILDNAFRYSQKGTLVTVSAGKTNEQVAVQVKDRGKGLTTEQQKELFRYFTQLDEAATPSGSPQFTTGLGLYVSKLIIERARGQLKLSSQPDKGTTVIIYLNKGGKR